MQRALTLSTDYHQFAVEDENCDPLAAASPQFWNARAQADGLASGRNMLAVGTARFGQSRVEIEVRQDAPLEDFDEWDHVTECGIEIPSGVIVIRGGAEAPQDAARMVVEPGMYRARAFYGNLAVEAPDAEEGDDLYRVVLWPCHEWTEPRVLKNYNQENDE